MFQQIIKNVCVFTLLGLIVSGLVPAYADEDMQDISSPHTAINALLKCPAQFAEVAKDPYAQIFTVRGVSYPDLDKVEVFFISNQPFPGSRTGLAVLKVRSSIQPTNCSARAPECPSRMTVHTCQLNIPLHNAQAPCTKDIGPYGYPSNCQCPAADQKYDLRLGSCFAE